MHKFKINDKVRVIDIGKLYSDYTDWFKYHHLSSSMIEQWKTTKTYFPECYVFEVIASGKHSIYNNRYLYYCYCKDYKKSVLISEDGLEKAEDKVMNTEKIKVGSIIRTTKGNSPFFRVIKITSDGIIVHNPFEPHGLAVKIKKEFVSAYEVFSRDDISTLTTRGLMVKSYYYEDRTDVMIYNRGVEAARGTAKYDPDDIFNPSIGFEIAYDRALAELKERLYIMFPEDRIRVGDKVKIIDKSKINTRNWRWLTDNARHYAKWYSYGNTCVDDGLVYKVMAIGEGKALIGVMGYVETPLFLFNLDGLKKYGD